MEKAKDAIKVIIFFVLLVISIAFTGLFLSMMNDSSDWEIINGFYQKETDSMDVVCLGSSGMFTSFSPGLAYHLCGFTSYDYGTNTMPFSSFKYAIEDIEKTQDPKLYVIELETASWTEERQTSISDLHRYSDVMPFSANKVQMITDILGSEMDDALFHSLSLNHYRYYRFKKRYSDILFRLQHCRDDEKLNGCLISSAQPSYTESDYTLNTNDGAKEPLPEGSETYLIDLLEYIKAHQLNVLFIYAPRVSTFYKTMNSVGDIVSSYGYDFINYAEDLAGYGIDPSEDFYNMGHMNVLGQEKFTRVLAEEICKRINLTEKNSSTIERWEEYYEYYHEKSDEAKALNKQGIKKVFMGYDPYLQ